MDRHYYKHRFYALITKGLENLKQNHRKENNAQDNGRYPNANRKFTKAILKESDELKNRNTHSDHHHLENDITTPEVSSAIKSLKLDKAPGPDGIHNEFIKNCGTKLVHWLNEFLNICCRHIRIPKQWRHANVISILKPGKPEASLRSYLPISLLCTTYKLLEQILLTRIESIIDKLLPKEQAGFRKGCSTVDQVAKLTETIEDVFDKTEITGSVFIDLTAACDTVWHQGLRGKLLQMLTPNHLNNFMMELLYIGSFILFTRGEQKIRSFRSKNGVAQGSVLAPTLYNIYTNEFPKTSGNCFMYADDVAITYSASNIAKVEENLSNDMKTICQYLHDWHLKLSQSKTVSSLFHIKNNLASKSINVTLDPNTILNCERYPTYLGFTLDRSLTYKNHLHTLKQKVSSRVALVRKLSGTN